MNQIEYQNSNKNSNIKMSRAFKVANCWKKRKIYVNFTNQKRKKNVSSWGRRDGKCKIGPLSRFKGGNKKIKVF